MLKKISVLVLFSFCFALLLTSVAAAQFHAQELPMKHRWDLYRIIPKHDNLSSEVMAVLSFTQEDGWHTYSHSPGELGKPTRLLTELGSGGSLTVYYPAGTPKKDTFSPDITVNVYEGTTRLFIPLPAAVQAPFNILANLEILLCSDTKCLPASVDIPFQVSHMALDDLPVANSQPWWTEFIAASKTHPLGEKADVPSVVSMPLSGEMDWDLSPIYFQASLEVESLLTAILFGLLAGLILNVMPCVLPVISLKLSAVLASCSQQDERTRRRLFRSHNILFSLGIMSWFVILAAVLSATGQAWGEIFQQTWMIMSLTAIVFALSLSLFGLYSLPIVDLKFDQKSKSPRAQAFFTGMLTTLLATPCSGPFLGGVLGWALLQPPFVIMAVFLSIGFGMTLPYIMLTLFPNLVRFLPTPGPWVQVVEKAVAFFLAGTCIYLINILPDAMILPMLVLMWMTVPAAWLWGKAGPGLSTVKRWSLRLAGILLFSVALFWALSPGEDDFRWTNFDAQEVAGQVGKSTMFIDFTADWCPTCKVIERTVLTNENLLRWKEKYDITFIRVDLTENNPDGEKLLHALGSRSIPAAALFRVGSEGQSPVVLRDIFTVSQLENLLNSYKE